MVHGTDFTSLQERQGFRSYPHSLPSRAPLFSAEGLLNLTVRLTGNVGIELHAVVLNTLDLIIVPAGMTNVSDTFSDHQSLKRISRRTY